MLRGWTDLLRALRDVRLLRKVDRGQLRLDQLPPHLQDDVRVVIARRRLDPPAK